MQLHETQGHIDEQILQHAKELAAELSAAGIQPTPETQEQDINDDDDAWEDEEGDVEME